MTEDLKQRAEAVSLRASKAASLSQDLIDGKVFCNRWSTVGAKGRNRL